MQTEWIDDLPGVVLFIIGIGGLAGALLAIVKLWKEFIPDDNQHLARDISSIKSDVHDVRKRVGMLEIELAKIDQPGLVKRLDHFEAKIDKLHDLMIERFTSKRSPRE